MKKEDKKEVKTKVAPAAPSIRSAAKQRSMSVTSRAKVAKKYLAEHPDIIPIIEKCLDDNINEDGYAYFPNKERLEVAPLKIVLETLGYQVFEEHPGIAATGPFRIRW